MRDGSIVDVVCGLGFVVTGSNFRLATAARALLLAEPTAIWGLRLTGCRAWRNLD